MMLDITDIVNRTDNNKDHDIEAHFTKDFQLQLRFYENFILLWSKFLSRDEFKILHMTWQNM